MLVVGDKIMLVVTVLGVLPAIGFSWLMLSTIAVAKREPAASTEVEWETVESDDGDEDTVMVSQEFFAWNSNVHVAKVRWVYVTVIAAAFALVLSLSAALYGGRLFGNPHGIGEDLVAWEEIPGRLDSLFARESGGLIISTPEPKGGIAAAFTKQGELCSLGLFGAAGDPSLARARAFCEQRGLEPQTLPEHDGALQVMWEFPADRRLVDGLLAEVFSPADGGMENVTVSVSTID